MSGLCYWCQNRSVMQCAKCVRDFCKFCIKIDESQNETKVLCLICGCFEITENTSVGDAIGRKMSNFLDREVQDMLHRYENLCKTDILMNSTNDLLIGIDSWSLNDVPHVFKMIKSNIFSMVHDVQKVESMINEAKKNDRITDINSVLLPLLKVVLKHHVFKRWDFAESLHSADSFAKTENFCVQESEKSKNEESFIDLTDSSMHVFCDIEVNERMQRSPLCLREEEKAAENFIISEFNEDDISENQSMPIDIVVNPSPLKDIVIEEKKLPSKRKRPRQIYEGERQVVLRSDKSISKVTNSFKLENCSFNSLLSDLNEANTLLKTKKVGVIKEPKTKKTRSCSKEKTVELSDHQSFSSNESKLNLNRFMKIVKRDKNAHLVSPAPTYYEKPFLLKETSNVVSNDDAKAVSNKIWSWERKPTVSKCVKTIQSKNFSNGLGTPIIIKKSISSLLESGIISSTEKSFQLADSSARSYQATDDSISELVRQSSHSDEPKKKRGRPRIYFNNSSLLDNTYRLNSMNIFESFENSGPK